MLGGEVEALRGIEELRLIAEVGVALAGLIAIFLVLTGRDGRFSAAESLHVRSLLASSACVVGFALVPLVLGLYIDSEPAIWRTSSGVCFVVGLLVCADFARIQFSMRPGERWGLSFGSFLGIWVLVVCALVLFAINLVGLAGGPGAAHYIAGLVSLVVAALLNFTTIALRRLL